MGVAPCAWGRRGSCRASENRSRAKRAAQPRAIRERAMPQPRKSGRCTRRYSSVHRGHGRLGSEAEAEADHRPPAESLPCERAHARVAVCRCAQARAHESHVWLRRRWLQSSVVGEAAFCARRVLGGPPHAAQTPPQSPRACRGRTSRARPCWRVSCVCHANHALRDALGGGMADGGMRSASVHALLSGLGCTGQGGD
jgi:hypothetical protein